MASSALVEPATVCDQVQRLRDVSRLILDAIERDDLEAMQRHVNESDRLIASIGDGLAAHRGPTAESHGLLDHIRVMNDGMVERLRERQAELLAEISRARSFWQGVRNYRSPGDGAAEALDRES